MKKKKNLLAFLYESAVPSGTTEADLHVRDLQAISSLISVLDESRVLLTNGIWPC